MCMYIYVRMRANVCECLQVHMHAHVYVHHNLCNVVKIINNIYAVKYMYART